VIGGIACQTERLRLGTGVTRPTIRIHPAIVVHAPATCGAMMPGRFFLGVGSGENLHQIGADREGFFRVYEREVMPEIGVAISAR
jgi:alkanesulfonate monooxygenase SsuD/methylene tetrahydromethanopterin reductase-like flavin-dependent oxidoreductase (luciferase family)